MAKVLERKTNKKKTKQPNVVLNCKYAIINTEKNNFSLPKQVLSV